MEVPRYLTEANTVVENVHYADKAIVIHHVDSQMVELQRDEQLPIEIEAKKKVSRIEWIVWEMDAMLEDGVHTVMIMGENEDGSPLALPITHDIFEAYKTMMQGQVEYLGYEHGIYEDWMQDSLPMTMISSGDLPNV